MTMHIVQGDGGLRLHVLEWGKADGPLRRALYTGVTATHRMYHARVPPLIQSCAR